MDIRVLCFSHNYVGFKALAAGLLGHSWSLHFPPQDGSRLSQMEEAPKNEGPKSCSHYGNSNINCAGQNRISRETKIHTYRQREYFSLQQVTFEEWSVTDRDMVKQRTTITGNILLVWLSVDFFSFSDLPACADTLCPHRSMWLWVHSTKLALLVAAIREKFHTALQS